MMLRALPLNPEAAWDDVVYKLAEWARKRATMQEVADAMEVWKNACVEEALDEQRRSVLA